jgi:hypothetical protein
VTFEYDAAGRKTKSRSTWPQTGGLRHYDTRISDAEETTELLDSEERLITFAGYAPDGQAPPGGWGVPSGGLAVHLAVTPDRGRPLQIKLALTAFDVKVRKASTYGGVFPYLELRNSNDRVVAQTARYTARVEQYRRNLPPTGAPCETQAWLSGPGGVGELDFEEAYGEVPAGAYTVVAGACLDGQAPISDTVVLIIEDATQH